MANFSVRAFNLHKKQEEVLLIHPSNLLLVYSMEQKLKNTIFISEQLHFKTHPDCELEIRTEYPLMMSLRFQFESYEVLNDFISRVKKQNKTYQRRIQSVVSDTDAKKILCHKYNFKNAKQANKYFWVTPDFNEIRWASTKTSKNPSILNVSEIKDIKLGPFSKNFRRVLTRYGYKAVSFHLCLSFITAKRTVDIEVFNECDLRIFLETINYMLVVKQIRIPKILPLNMFRFTMFKLKMTKSAHTMNLIYSTLLKIRLHKATYNSPRNNSNNTFVTKIVPTLNFDAVRAGNASSKRAFIHHKRNSTLSNYAHSVDDQNTNLYSSGNGHIYTDRRYYGEYSRGSSTGSTNSIIQYPLSHRVDNSLPALNFSGLRSSHQASQPNLYTPISRNPPEKRPSSMYYLPSRKSDISSVQSPITITQEHHDLTDFQPKKSPSQFGNKDMSMKLYYNMDGSSKDYSSVLRGGEEHSIAARVLPENLNTEMTKLNSPHGNISTINFSTRSDGDYQPLLNRINSTKVMDQSHHHPHILIDDEKENIPPVPTEKKKGQKPMISKLNLQNVLRDRTNLPETLEYNDKEYFNSIQTAKMAKYPNSHREKIIQVPTTINKGHNSSRDLHDSHTLTQTKNKFQKPITESFTITEKSEKSIMDESSQNSLNKTNASYKRKVKLTLDKNSVKNKILQAWQNSQTPNANNQNTSTIGNQSFAYENAPANLSIDVSKIEFNLEVNKSKISIDEKTEQITSRFRADSALPSSIKKGKTIIEDTLKAEDIIIENKDEDDGKLTAFDLFPTDITEIKEDKTMSEKTRGSKPKFCLNINTDMINVENELNSLKEQFAELRRENEMLKQSNAEKDEEFAKHKKMHEEEIQNKTDSIDELFSQFQAVQSEKKANDEKLRVAEERVQFYIKREQEQMMKVETNEQRLKEDLHRLAVECNSLRKNLTGLNEKYELSQKEVVTLKGEKQKLKEMLSKVSDQKSELEKRSAPKVTLDLTSMNKVKTLQTEIAQIRQSADMDKKSKDELEKELKKTREALENLKITTRVKITKIVEGMKFLRQNANDLKTENAENIKDFLEVWPSLVNIYEYLGKQNAGMEAQMIVINKENQILKEHLRNRSTNSIKSTSNA